MPTGEALDAGALSLLAVLLSLLLLPGTSCLREPVPEPDDRALVGVRGVVFLELGKVASLTLGVAALVGVTGVLSFVRRRALSVSRMYPPRDGVVLLRTSASETAFRPDTSLASFAVEEELAGPQDDLLPATAADLLFGVVGVARANRAALTAPSLSAVLRRALSVALM